ncbi:uncharacterized protein HaLaN_13397 [Haematococcus lacustris]|uniref:Uncharacterized protein n=1 Tax=Haematococcus lacustris TaxID=44745 RepID=A0A699Z5R6_HAELA|nr:uncharacterized protein HaLaN_13397 [Haematococcus lacustris]
MLASLRAEFWKVCSRTALGFVVMGFIGFFVKLLFIIADVGEDQTGAKGSILHGSEDGAAGHIVAVRYEFVRSSAAGQDV